MATSVASLSDPILDSIERDLVSAKEHLTRYEAENKDAGPVHEKLVGVEHAVWGVIIDDLGIEAMDDAPEEVLAQLQTAQLHVDKSRKRMVTLDIAIVQTQRKIAQLQNSAEYDRRAGVKVRTTEARRRSNMAKETAQEQGVPEEYINGDTGNFKVGADARYKSDLVNSALGLEGVGMLKKFEVKDAEARLAQRNWTGFLTRKKEINAEREATAAAKASEKEATARERAEAKAASKAVKDAEKAAAKQATKDKDAPASSVKAPVAAGEAKADPKGGKR